MGQYNWIDGNDFDINCFFLMDRWMLKMIFEKYETMDVEDFHRIDVTLATLLKQSPRLQWFILRKEPALRKSLDNLLKGADFDLKGKKLRSREIELMEALETDVVYTNPSVMASSCNYITAWNEKTLYDLVDLKDKIVLDLGAGTGRLTFAAAKLAKRVYASEPVDMLREHMRDKIRSKNIRNIKVLDGIVLNIPYEDDTFDVVLSGHVVGDDTAAEIQEMTRVAKDGGKIVICNGDDDIKRDEPSEELVKHGFKVHYHKSSLGGDIYNYTKTVKK